MSLLFQISNKIVTPNVETLLIPLFGKIWERDVTPDKVQAIEDFTYIEFCTSEKKSNPYSGTPLHLREAKVKKEIITREGWEEDSLIVEAKEYLKKHQEENSLAYNQYISARIGAEKLQQFFLTFDMDSRNVKTGNPLYKPKEISSSLLDVGVVTKNLVELYEKVTKDLFENVKYKGGKEISDFANPDSL